MVASTVYHYTTMDGATIEPAFRIFLAEIHSKLNEAAGIASLRSLCAVVRRNAAPADGREPCI
jgi:hypothetical protein